MSMKIETMAVHAGHAVDTAIGAVAKPITLSVTYARDPGGEYSRKYFYSSQGNPNREAFEECVAALEGGDVAIAFATGMAAISASLRATLRPGDHVLVPDDVFQGTIRNLRYILAKWNVSFDVVDMTDVDAVAAAMRDNTRVIWCETLSNPLLKVTDVGRIAEIAHSRRAVCIVDNSFVTPILQRPLELGVDLVVHAATKYMGGHGDVLAGVAAAPSHNKALIDELRLIQLFDGAVLSPFDCWLAHRGLRTLACRVRDHAENALRVARFLETHPGVAAVHYPGLERHPQHALAKRLIGANGGYGGIVSFQVKGGREAAVGVAASTKLFTNATSFGEVDSLIQHQASSPTHGPNTGLVEDLLRLSVGLEHSDDLVTDLAQALDRVSNARRVA